MAIWPFGRRRDADEPTPEPDAGESASPTTGEADVARPERVPTGDWMTVPPVRTSMVPAMPTTFRVQTLPEILTSHQDSRLSTSLGHAVSSDAPSGVIGGLARATSSLGAVSHEGTGGATAVLHEPVHPAKAEPEEAPPMQRRLATTDAPLAITSTGPLGTMAPPAPALPEPAVSRVLASPAPMPSPASLGASPLPVARVIDTTPAPTAGATGTSTPPGPAAPAGAEPGSATDDRVGGFEVDLTSLLGGTAKDDDLPVITPPADLAPPIQRSVRRDTTPPTLRAPVQRAAGPAAPAPSLSPSPPASHQASDATTGPLGQRPTAGTDPLAPSDGAPLSSTGATAPASPGAGPDLTLAAPPVQRSAEAGVAAGAEHFPGDGHDHGDDDGGVQRLADAGPTATPATAAAPEGATVDDAPEPGPSAKTPATAPIAGADLLAPVSDSAPLVGDETGDDPAPAPSAEELPLVARSVEPTAPTLGTTGGPGPSLLPLQTLSDTAQISTEGGSTSLPLAPPEQPGTLTPPAGPSGASASTTGLVGDGPLPTVSGGTAPGSTGDLASATPARPLAAPRPTGPGGASSTGGPGPLAVAQRSMAASTSGAIPATTAPSSLRPLASSAGSLLLASPTSAGGTDVTPAPMTVLGGAMADAPAVPLQRSLGDDGFASPILAAPRGASGASLGATSLRAGGAPATPSATSRPFARSAPATSGAASASALTPVTPLVAQRAADDGSSGASAMPLHTAAANVPSTTDLLVKAGLGEKAPDGTFLRSTPPPGVESSFTVQTQPEAAGAPPVQRAVHIEEMTTSVTPSPTGPSTSPEGGASEPDIRKLYFKLRAELEADLRRQLEAKSRYNRYRP